MLSNDASREFDPHLLTHALGAASTAIVITDRDGVIKWVNAAFTALTGYTASEVVGHTPSLLRSGRYDRRFYQEMWETILSGLTWRGELLNRRKDGSLYLEQLTISPVRSAGGRVTHFVAIKLDATTSRAAGDERKTQVLYEDAPVPYQALDAAGRVIEINRAWLEALGYAREEVTGRWFGDFLAPSQADLFREQFLNLKTGGSLRAVEFEMQRKTGEPLAACFDANVARDQAGNFLRADCVFQDFTARKAAERALGESERRYWTLVESSPDMVFLLDCEGAIRRANAAAAKFFAVGENTLTGRALSSLMPAEPGRRIAEKLQAVLAGGRAMPPEEIGHADGPWVEMRLVPVRQDTGAVDSVLAVARDITVPKRLELELREKGERFERIVEGCEAGYFRLGCDGRFEDVNACWLRMHGYSSKEDIVGRHFSVVQTPQDSQRAAEIVASLLAGGANQSGEGTRRCKDGSVGYQTFSATPVLQGGIVAGLEGFIIDTTARRQAEQEQRSSEERYRALFNSMNDGLALHSIVYGVDGRPLNYRLLEVNGEYERIVGKTRAEVAGRLATEVYGTAAAPYLEEFSRVVDSRKPLFFETYFPPMDKHFAISVTPMGGALFATIFFDITGREKAAEQLREKEAKFRTPVENRLEGVAILDPQRRFVFANPAAEELFGVGCLAGRSLREFVPPDQAEAVEEAAESRRSYLLTVTGPDNTSRSLLVASTPCVGEAGRLLGTFQIFRDANERARAAESPSFAQFALDNSPDPAFLLGPDGRIFYVNHAACARLGYSRDELLAMNILDVDAGMEKTEFDGHWSTVRQSGAAVLNAAHRARDGEVFPVEIRATHLRFEGREFTASFARDISARLRAEAEARQQREDYRVIFDSAPGPILYLDRNHRVLRTNDAAAQLIALPVEQLVGKTIWECFPEELAQAYVADNEEVMASGKPRLGLVEPYRTPSGEQRWALTDRAPYRNAQGEVAGVVIHISDITERKRVEEALRKRDSQLRRAHRLAAMGTWEIDFTTGALVWSEEVYDMFGLGQGDPLDRRRFFELVHPDDRGQIQAAAVKLTATGAPYGLDHRIIRPDGAERWIRETAEAVRDTGGLIVGMSGTAQDITEHRRLEEQFLQAQKLESVGRLAGGVAHDFNNLLTVINGYADLILSRLAEGDPLHSQVAEIKTAGERAGDLTRQLLAFSRKQVFQPEPLDLNTLIAESEGMLQRLLGEDIWLKAASDVTPARILADRGQVHQIMMNMVVNARDAMPAGGRITLETRTVELDESHAVPPMKPGRYVLLSISDTGVGMDEQTRTRIFEPFFTTKPKGSGTGLGLSTVYGIVKQSGGWIWVDSEPGAGATFRIYFPAYDSEARPIEDREPPAAPDSGSETILVVEDQEDVRRLTAEMLELLGYRVLAAADGADALLVAEKYDGPIHLLITDVVMPGMPCAELATRLKKLRPALKVLYVSGYTESDIAHRGILNPGIEYLPKPFTQTSLASRVRGILGAAASSRTILIVDDDPGVRSVFRYILESAGYRVIEAADGREAENLARDRGLDLVITDIVMPEREGLEIIRAFHEQRPDLRIIAVSGAFHGQFLRAAGLLGADLTLTKPVRPEDLLAAVRKLLTGNPQRIN